MLLDENGTDAPECINKYEMVSLSGPIFISQK